jgi:chloramphenicol O-acetyltransferase type A
MTDPEDAVPRIAWGRYEEKQGKKVLSMCFEVNHRLIDGCHIGQFHEAFRKRACSLERHTL